MMTDPIADMLTRIRNAQRAGKEVIEIPFSNMKHAIAQILLKEGYLGAVEVTEAPKQMVLTLKYLGKQPAIQSIDRDSKPGHRVYRKASELPRILNDYGVAIVSTSRGLMTNKEARKLGIGGEVVCSIY